MANNERPSYTAARLLNALRADRYIARNFADELFQLGSLIDAIARDAEMRPVVNAVTDKVLADMLEGGAIVRIDPSAMFKTDSESDRLAALSGAAPVATTETVKVEAGFVYENGIHTPTVLVSFNPNDWAARDQFVAKVKATHAPSCQSG